MRVAVIGARRVHQGIGEHLARFCHQAGATVAAVYGTTPETSAAAADHLEHTLGSRPEATTTPEDLFAVSGLDAVVIAGPFAAHETWLTAALERQLHVLCEKPLLWGGADPDLRAERMGRAFFDAGLVLRVNAQWPYTLGAYRELFPETAAQPASFYMRLSPDSAGSAMFLESLSHPLSILATVLPDPEAEITERHASHDDHGGHISFGYRSGDHTIQCELELEQMPAQPRLAAYGFDGRLATRIVDMADYSLELEGDGRRVPMPDPTSLLVGSFLDEVASGRPRGLDPALLPGMRHLVRLMEALPRTTHGSSEDGIQP